MVHRRRRIHVFGMTGDLMPAAEGVVKLDPEDLYSKQEAER